jgi:hypothetical protein
MRCDPTKPVWLWCVFRSVYSFIHNSHSQQLSIRMSSPCVSTPDYVYSLELLSVKSATERCLFGAFESLFLCFSQKCIFNVQGTGFFFSDFEHFASIATANLRTNSTQSMTIRCNSEFEYQFEVTNDNAIDVVVMVLHPVSHLDNATKGQGKLHAL